MDNVCDFLSVPPAEWDGWLADASGEEASTAEYNMAAVAQRATLAAIYLEERYLGATHERAVDRANVAVYRLRKILGYKYPERGTFRF